MRWLWTAALAALLSLLVSAPALAVESAVDLPPDADPMATLMVVFIGAVLVSAWTAFRDHRAHRR